MTLDAVQVRVLGALMEKEIATPEGYPLSLNSLVLACNQRSSRDPVMELVESEVRQALHTLEDMELTAPVRDSRVAKYEHRIRTVLNLRRDETAVLCLLFLRGPQTPGELRQRADRLFRFDDLEAVQATLERMAAKPEGEAAGLRPLVVMMPRQPGSRESRYAHLLGGAGGDGGAERQRAGEWGADDYGGAFERAGGGGYGAAGDGGRAGRTVGAAGKTVRRGLIGRRFWASYGYTLCESGCDLASGAEVSPRPMPDFADRNAQRDVVSGGGEGVRADAALLALLDDIPEGVMCFDRSWVITFANKEGRKISRLMPEDIHRRTHWELFPETVGTVLEATYLRVMETRVPERIEYYYEPFDLWVDVRVMPNGEGVALYYRDLSAQRKAEQSSERSARQLNQVFDVTTDGIIALDREWNIEFLNRMGEKLLAAKPGLMGKNLWAEFPLALGTAYEVNYRRTMSEGVTTEFEEYYPEPLNLWLWIQARPSDDGMIVFFRNVTERRQREEELLRQQALLTVVQQTALAATWECDLATGRLTFGPGAFALFGRPLAEVGTAAELERLIYPADLARTRVALREALSNPALAVAEFRVVAPDGTLVWLETRGQAIQEEGVPRYLRGMSIDISKRKRNEEALVASESRYRVLADLNPQAIWMGAPDGRITYANQGFLDFIGLTLETIGGLGWLNAFYPADHAAVIEAWTRSVASGVNYDVEARMIRARDGAVRWWWLRALPVRDESGAILHWLGVGADIHDNKIAAEALQQRQQETERQRAELETVYQTAPVGLALFDPVEFRYLRINERQGEILGLPSERIIGRTYAEIAPLHGLEEMFHAAAAGHAVKHQVLEGELATRPGEHRIWNVSHTPVYGPDGGIQAITAAWSEITHLKKAEAALVQSEKLAAVGRLASSISHEINNPLEAITNLLYLVALNEELPPDLKVYVHMAQSELARVSQIATQTLRFHRQAVRPTEVSPAELIDAVLNLYQGRLANSGIRIEAKYATKTRVLCFENDIRQVLNNLIANAIDAMRGGGRLVVRAHEACDHATGRKGVRLAVADTGHGMSKAVLKRLFEPFYTTKDLNGTGLGLWISEGIVQRHQGRLTVRSTQDARLHGTVFSLFLPCKEVSGAEISSHPMGLG